MGALGVRGTRPEGRPPDSTLPCARTRCGSAPALQPREAWPGRTRIPTACAWFWKGQGPSPSVRAASSRRRSSWGCAATAVTPKKAAAWRSAGRLRYASPSGLSLEVSLHALVVHEAAGYEDWGASGMLRFDPGRKGLGFTASVVALVGHALGRRRSALGRSRRHGPRSKRRARPGPGTGGRATGLRLRRTLGGRGRLTPYARAALGESRRPGMAPGHPADPQGIPRPEPRGNAPQAAGRRAGTAADAACHPALVTTPPHHGGGSQSPLRTGMACARHRSQQARRQSRSRGHAGLLSGVGSRPVSLAQSRCADPCPVGFPCVPGGPHPHRSHPARGQPRRRAEALHDRSPTRGGSRRAFAEGADLCRFLMQLDDAKEMAGG